MRFNINNINMENNTSFSIDKIENLHDESENKDNTSNVLSSEDINIALKNIDDFIGNDIDSNWLNTEIRTDYEDLKVSISSISDILEQKKLLLQFIDFNFSNDFEGIKDDSLINELKNLNTLEDKIAFFDNNNLWRDFFSDNMWIIYKKCILEDSNDFDISLLKKLINNDYFREVFHPVWVLIIEEWWINELFEMNDEKLIQETFSNEKYLDSLFTYILKEKSINENSLEWLLQIVDDNNINNSKIINILFSYILKNPSFKTNDIYNKIINKEEFKEFKELLINEKYLSFYNWIKHKYLVRRLDLVDIIINNKEWLDELFTLYETSKDWLNKAFPEWFDFYALIDINFIEHYSKKFKWDKKVLKPIYDMYFKLLNIFWQYSAEFIYDWGHIFNKLYEWWYDINWEKDQKEMLDHLDTDTTILMLWETKESSLNISHKMLTWHLLWKPWDETMVWFTNNQIISSYSNLSVKDKYDFISSMFTRTWREELLLSRFTIEERKIFLWDFVSWLLNKESLIKNEWIMKFLNNNLYWKEFAQILYDKIIENNYSKEELLVLVSVSENLKSIALNDKNYLLDKEKISQLENEMNKSWNFDINTALKDWEWRSVTMFVWDPTNTDQDNNTTDKRMQLSDFNSTLKLDLANDYNISSIILQNWKKLNLSKINLNTRKGKEQFYDKYISKGKIKSITLDKMAHWIRDIHEIVLSNNNSNNDFKHYSEHKNNNWDSKYDQIDIRWHCWTNEEAIWHWKNWKYDRTDNLLLINWGCFQEGKTSEYSFKLNNKAFQVATTQTWLWEQMTSRLSIEYRKLILKEYSKEKQFLLDNYKKENKAYKWNFIWLPDNIKDNIIINMNNIDEQIREQEYFKKIVKKNVDAAWVALTQESLSRKIAMLDVNKINDLWFNTLFNFENRHNSRFWFNWRPRPPVDLLEFSSPPSMEPEEPIAWEGTIASSSFNTPESGGWGRS